MVWTRDEVRQLVWLNGLRATLMRERRALLAKRYDPNQPRVPAGSPEGGRWADAGGDGTQAETTLDRTGERSWERVITRRDEAGRVTSHSVFNRDGSRVTTSYRRDVEASLVTTPDGRITSFATSGPIQIVRDGLTGSVLSASEFRPGEHEPLVQLAQAGALSRGRQASDAATTLWGWRNDRQRQAGDEDVPVLLRSMPMSHTSSGLLAQSRDATIEEVRRLCPRYDEVQSIVDNVAREMNGLYRDGATYGRELHRRVDELIKSMNDSGLHSERTFGGRRGDLNEAGSSRLDILERPPGTPRLGCDYDIKTGGDGFTERDMRRHARAVLGRDINHLVTIQMRPTVPRVLRGQSPW
jgi:hypothetical protein